MFHRVIQRIMVARFIDTVFRPTVQALAHNEILSDCVTN